MYVVDWHLVKNWSVEESGETNLLCCISDALSLDFKRLCTTVCAEIQNKVRPI